MKKKLDLELHSNTDSDHSNHSNHSNHKYKSKYLPMFTTELFGVKTTQQNLLGFLE